jgi:DHA3 family tetracycline resistance protein-like MFS transporter
MAVLARWGKGVAHSIQDPIYRAWLNQSIEPRVRATVLSMTNQSDAIGQIAGGPGVGAVGRYVSLQAALALSGLLLVPALPLYARAHRQGSEATPEEQMAEAPAPVEA